MSRSQTFSTMLAASVLLLSAVEVGVVSAEITVPDGFSVDTLTLIPFEIFGYQPGGDGYLLMSLAIRLDGSPFPPLLYACLGTGHADPPGGLACYPDDPANDFLYRITADGEVFLFATFPECETDPSGPAFDPVGTFGSNLYVAANNMDGYQDWDQGGAILQVDASGNISVFYPNDEIITEPGYVTFATPLAEGFPQELYVSNSTDLPFGLFSITSAGVLGSYTLPSELAVSVKAFGPGGEFSTGLYFAQGGAPTIRVADSTGATLVFASLPCAGEGDLRFPSPGPFGSFLYVSCNNTGEIFRVASTGDWEVFASGFTTGGLKIVFSDEGRELYAASVDFASESVIVYVISSEPLPVAVCCVDEECSIISEEECMDLGGTWHPEWDSCDPNPCPGACCDCDVCLFVTFEECEAGGYEPGWQGNIPCDPNPCDFPPTPALLSLSEVSVLQAGFSVELTWTTSFDVDGGVFHIYRGASPDQDGDVLTTIESSDGPRWSYRDATVVPGETYHYCIEVVTGSGSSSRFGPWSVTVIGPTKPTLLGNDPNPVLEQTTIRFYVPKRSDARLEIYGPNGRLVRSMKAKALSPGAHSFVWDRMDQQGRLVAKGAYFYSVKVGATELSGKVTVLR